MTKIHLNELLDDEFTPTPRRERARGKFGRRGLRRDHAHQLDELVEHSAPANVGAEAVFQPTFTASRHEREWILNFLGPFYDDRLITDVLGRVKGGKEANVYCCEGHPDSGLELIAAKIYRPRMFRQLRQDARYRQGRLVLDATGKEVRDGRALRAIAKHTRIGQELMHTSWLEHEFQALTALHAAGADVPRPVARSDNTILMEYVGDADVPAPALRQVRLASGEARPLFGRLMESVEIMLAHGLVHADLSAYNVLYWEGRIKLIDFPQIVDVRRNPDAPELLRRDIERVSQYFARYGVHTDAGQLAGTLWEQYAARDSAAARERARAVEALADAEEG